MRRLIPFLLLFGIATSADPGPRLTCRVVVPRQYRHTPWDPPPNGQPEPVRYTVAYEAFWWNCVAVRAAHLDGRCPFTASGTPAAGAGANDGAMDADKKIDRLLKKYSAQRVQTYLRELASEKVATEKMRPYFDKPRPEVVN